MTSPSTAQSPQSHSKKYHYFDNTRVSCAKNCLRQYYLRHIRDWVRDGKSIALSFGSSWHAAMDTAWGLFWTDHSDKEILTAAISAFNKHWTEEENLPAWETITPEQEDQFAPRTPGIAAEMLHNYISLRRPMLKKHYSLVSIERPFAVPIFSDSSPIFYIGKLDKVIKENATGKHIIVEHKTTTAYKKNGPFRTDYFESWSPNSQVDGYLYAGNMIYGQGNVKEVWVDAALVHKQVHDGFKIIPVNRQLPILDTWLHETRFWITIIQSETDRYASDGESQSRPAFYSFPKNTGACSHYSGCGFRDICKMISNPDAEDSPPLGYKEEHWEPFDILGLEKIGFKRDEEV